MPAFSTFSFSTTSRTRPEKATTITLLVPILTTCVPLVWRRSPNAASSSVDGSCCDSFFSFLGFTSTHFMEDQTVRGLPSLSASGLTALRQTAAPRAAPIRLPTRAWVELLGMPYHHVRRFQKMADNRTQMRTGWVM